MEFWMENLALFVTHEIIFFFFIQIDNLFIQICIFIATIIDTRNNTTRHNILL